jgi:hypothetical protein
MYTNQIQCNVTRYVKMKIQYAINSLGVGRNKTKASQKPHVDQQA